MVDYSKWDNLDISDDEPESSPIQPHSRPQRSSAPLDSSPKTKDQKSSVEEFTHAIVNNQVLFRRLQTLLRLEPDDLRSRSIESLVTLSRNDDEPASTATPKDSYDTMIRSILANLQSTDPKAFSENLKEHKKKLGLVVTYYQHQLAGLQGQEIEPMKEEINNLKLEEVKGSKSRQVSYPSISTSTPKLYNSKADGNTPALRDSASISTASTFFDKFFAQMPQPYPQTLQFAQLPIDACSFDSQHQFLTKYPFIMTANQKQAIIMAVFQLELQPGSSSTLSRQYIFNATLLEFAERIGIDSFFKELANPDVKNDSDKVNYNPNSLQEVLVSVTATLKDVQKSCQSLIESARAEARSHGKAEIQLFSVDPDNEFSDVVVTAPDYQILSKGDNKVRYEGDFTPEMRSAIEEGNLEKINDVLKDMPVKKAELVVKALDEWKVLSVEKKIYDATE
ncbi:Hsp90 co-chaperone CDC37 [Nadsonia fulvescens var. elongata DSM 6958]|uniref:Hsp90 chaperone protein kinase-targeting subunit n=1 Tax=Nadsonia fulvescens var. elongata DSM 6958 TaxID=857566 RepID=A0A1E3PL43_9ASCO|nr:Hsp90 co-chaperone CDC37 [Nadsonia fulvescens var. elongata DSM 6958]